MIESVKIDFEDTNCLIVFYPNESHIKGTCKVECIADMPEGRFIKVFFAKNDFLEYCDTQDHEKKRLFLECFVRPTIESANEWRKRTHT